MQIRGGFVDKTSCSDSIRHIVSGLHIEKEY